MHHLNQYLPVPEHSQDPHPLGQGDPIECQPEGQREEEQAGDAEELADGQPRCRSVWSL